MGEAEFKKVKNAPYFFDIDIEVLALHGDSLKIEGKEVNIDYFVYDSRVFVAECTYDLGEQLGEETISQKDKINSKLRQKIVKESGYDGDLVEEYFAVIFKKPEGSPAEFVKKNLHIFSKFMPTVDAPSSQVSYSEKDLTVVDWEGAIIITADGDYESDVELMKVGNYQLLRYRMLDAEVEKSLRLLRNRLQGGKKGALASGNKILRQAVDTQLSLLLDFDKVDQSLLLVGDWYSAKLYKAIVGEFYIEEWKNLVKEKLENLKEIDETMRQNLTFSWERLIDFVSIIGWAILLIGYFYLYVKDAGL